MVVEVVSSPRRQLSHCGGPPPACQYDCAEVSNAIAPCSHTELERADDALISPLPTVVADRVSGCWWWCVFSA